MVVFFNIEQIVSHPGVYNEYHFWPNSSSEEYEFTKQLVVDEYGNVWHNGDIYTEEDIYMISDFQENHGNYKYILEGSENKYIWADGSIKDTEESTNENLPF